MKRSQFRERELDVIYLFWKLLEQWKGLLIAGLIIAMLLPSLIFVRTRAGSKENVEVDPDVLNVLSLYSDFIDKRERFNSNFFNKIDLDNCQTVTCLFEYNAKIYEDSPNKIQDETTLGLLNGLYNLMLSDETFRTEMIDEIKNYWPKIDGSNLQNTMTITVVHTTAYGPGMITINNVIPKDKDPKELQDAITKSVYGYHERIADSIGKENTIRFVSCAYKQTDYATELKARNSRYDIVSSGNSQYKNAYNVLDKDSQNVVDKAKEKCGNSTDVSVYEAYLRKQASKSDRITKSQLIKYGGLGFIGGVLLYIFIYLVLVIAKSCVRSDDELEAATGIRNFGGIYEYPYTKPLQKFIHDRKVYSFRTKNGKSIARICDDIRSKLDFSGKNAFTLVTVGKLPDKARAINDEQIGILKDNSITVDTLILDNGPGAIEDSVFAKLDGVVIQLIGSRTKWSELASLYYKLKEYNIDMIGYEYIDG